MAQMRVPVTIQCPDSLDILLLMQFLMVTAPSLFMVAAVVRPRASQDWPMVPLVAFTTINAVRSTVSTTNARHMRVEARIAITKVFCVGFGTIAGMANVRKGNTKVTCATPMMLALETFIVTLT